MNMRFRIIIFVVFLSASLLTAPWCMAGFGDGSGPFDSGKSDENSNGSTINNDEGFGSELFGSAANEEGIMAGPPTRDFDPVPLDGGASLILLGGLGVGISRALRRRSKLNGSFKR